MQRCGLIFLTVDFCRKLLIAKNVRKVFHIRVFYCNKKQPPHIHKQKRKRKKNGGEGGGVAEEEGYTWFSKNPESNFS